MKIGMISPLNINMAFGATKDIGTVRANNLNGQGKDVFVRRNRNLSFDKFSADISDLEKVVVLDKVCRQGKKISMPDDWRKIMYHTAKYISGKSSCVGFVSGLLETQIGSLLLNDANCHSYISDLNKFYPKEMKFLTEVTDAYKYCLDGEDYFNKADADNILASSVLQYLN